MGGKGYNETGQFGVLNDLWEYDLQIGQWRWLHGNKLINQNSVFGTIGVGTASTRPDARLSAPCWVLGGKLYTFSGRGRSPGSTSDNNLLNEMWAYDIATNIWTLLKGYINTNEYDGYTYASYGVKGVENPNNRPGGIGEAGATVFNGRLILFGGYGRGQCGSCGGSKNNIWSYNPATNNWTFVEGSADNTAPLNFPDGPYTFTTAPVPSGSYGAHNPRLWVFRDKLYMIGGTTTESYRSFRNIWRFDICQLMPGICGPATGPAVSLPRDTSICGVNVFTLDAGNPGAKYLWSTSDTSQELDVTQSGQYWVEVTDPVTNQSARDTINIQFLAAPVLPFAGVLAPCEGEVLSLNAQNPGATYQWSNGSTGQQITVNTSGIYSVEISNGSMCTVSASLAVNYMPKPVFSLGNDTGFCAPWGGPVTLRPLSPGPNYSNHLYQWSNGSTDYLISASQEGTYHLKINNAFGCSFSDTIQVTADTAIAFSLGADTAICPGDSLVLGTYHPGYSYTWGSGSQDATIVVTQPGTYECSMMSPYGCYHFSSIYVGHLATQQPVVSGIQTVKNGKTVSFSFQNLTHVDSLYWDFGDGNTSNDHSPVHTYAQYGVYPAKLYFKNQCLHDSISIPVELTDTSTGIAQNNLLQAGIVLYPNPTSGNISIQSKYQPILSIKVRNAIGQELLFRDKINAREFHQNLEYLVDGVYFIIIETPQQQYYYGRIVKYSR